MVLYYDNFYKVDKYGTYIRNKNFIYHNYFCSCSTLGLEKQITEVSTTKESTKILQNWLKLHRNNPYPSKTEKVMLAYSTRMTITQISNWFGNARRRIKQQKSCDKSHDSLLESSYDENLHRSLQENAQMIKSSVTSGHPRKNETTPETDQKIIDNSFQTSLNDTYVTPDSGLESFTESGGSLQSKEDGKNDLKGKYIYYAFLHKTCTMYALHVSICYC